MKLVIDIDDADADRMAQLLESVRHRKYNWHCELRWFWPATQARAMTDVTSVTHIEIAK